MNVLVDTPVWSLALRRARQDLIPPQLNLRNALAELIHEGRVVMIGPIRQELLSGIREQAQSDRLRDELRSFKDLPLQTAYYERAAQMSNACRGNGVASSSVDMLICSVAHHLNLAIFTIDLEYERYAEILGLRLFFPDTRTQA